MLQFWLISIIKNRYNQLTSSTTTIRQDTQGSRFFFSLFLPMFLWKLHGAYILAKRILTYVFFLYSRLAGWLCKSLCSRIKSAHARPLAHVISLFFFVGSAILVRRQTEWKRHLLLFLLFGFQLFVLILSRRFFFV